MFRIIYIHISFKRVYLFSICTVKRRFFFIAFVSVIKLIVHCYKKENVFDLNIMALFKKMGPPKMNYFIHIETKTEAK